MPTFNCAQCGAAFTASHKPRACGRCRSQQIRSLRDGQRGNQSRSISHKSNNRKARNSGQLPTPSNSFPPISAASSLPTAGWSGPKTPNDNLHRLSIFSPQLIMTWLLVFAPILLLSGYAFHRLVHSQMVTYGYARRYVVTNFEQGRGNWQTTGNYQISEGQLRHQSSTGRVVTRLPETVPDNNAFEVEVEGFDTPN